VLVVVAVIPASPAADRADDRGSIHSGRRWWGGALGEKHGVDGSTSGGDRDGGLAGRVQGLLAVDRHGAPVAPVAAATAATAPNGVPAVAHQLDGSEAPETAGGGGKWREAAAGGVVWGGWSEQGSEVRFCSGGFCGVGALGCTPSVPV